MKILLMALVVAGMVGTVIPAQGGDNVHTNTPTETDPQSQLRNGEWKQADEERHDWFRKTVAPDGKVTRTDPDE